jgi:hypothetical protein
LWCLHIVAQQDDVGDVIGFGQGGNRGGHGRSRRVGCGINGGVLFGCG